MTDRFENTIRWLLLPLALTVLPPCIAAEYGYPLPMRLGGGVDPSVPTDSFPYCFSYQARFVGGSAGSSSFRTSLVKSRRDLLRELNVSASASGSYTFFSGSAAATVDERYSFSSDTITWTVSLRSNLGRAEIYDERLVPFAAKLIADKLHGEFASRCGTELVTQERREASITAVFSATNVSQEQRRALEAKFSGEATAAVWSAEATAKFRSFVDEVAKTSRINLDIVTIGGGGASDLAALFSDFGDLGQVSSILRNYAAKISFENAQATSYTTTKMTRYGWKGNTLDVSLMDVAIGDYYLLFRDADAVKQRAYGYINGTAPGAASLTQDQLVELTKVYAQADALVRKVVDTAKKCRKDEKACASSSSFSSVSVKWPKLDPVGNVDQFSKEVRCAQAPAPVAQDVQFLCSQDSAFRVFAKWDRVAGVEVFDIWQQRYSPGHGKSETMAQAYELYKVRMGAGAVDEQRFVELVTGERLSVAEASARGWSSRELSLNFLFGAATSNGSGLRTSLMFVFVDKGGVRTERVSFMY